MDCRFSDASVFLLLGTSGFIPECRILGFYFLVFWDDIITSLSDIFFLRMLISPINLTFSAPKDTDLPQGYSVGGNSLHKDSQFCLSRYLLCTGHRFDCVRPCEHP